MYILIVNPAAGNGAAHKYLGDVEALLKRRQIEYRIEESADAASITRLGEAAVAEASEGIILMGGDGSIFDLINGISGSDVPLLFLPCGTGNDFVRSLNLPKNPIEALEKQLDAPIHRIDVGRMNQLNFLNVSGTGFDVDVLRYAERYKARYSGLRPYMSGLFDALKSYRPMTAMVSYDDQPEERVSFAILSIGNGRYFGGGMKAVPDAIVDDGLFDVITVKPVPKWVIPILLIFFITGKHVGIGLGKLRRCKKFNIRCDGMTLNLDGELRAANEARYELLSQAVCVRIPK